MNEKTIYHTEWYKALSLVERADLLQNISEELSTLDINHQVADRRFKRWQAQAPFDKSDYFSRRLEMDHLTEKGMLKLLGAPTNVLRNNSKQEPNWLVKINDAYSKYHSSQDPFLTELLTANPQSIICFLYLIEPIILQGADELYQKIQKISENISFLPSADKKLIFQIFFPQLSTRLISLLNRTMILELNVARLNGELEGSSSDERYQSFICRIRQRDVALSILQEYASLAKLCITCVEQWVSSCISFLSHLHKDWAALCNEFYAGNTLGQLVEVTGGEGDSHRGGKTVMIAKFSSGLQIVYKPRSLDVDCHFQELLSWLNTKGIQPAFHLLKILPSETHGWVEFIQPDSCKSKEDVHRFYQSQGNYLALLYVLNAADFHFENLIACGEHPVLIDLEALFHQPIETVSIKGKSTIGAKRLADSVMQVGLLPQLIWGKENALGVDISGLGAMPGQIVPFQIPDWGNIGTDEMHIILRQGKMAGGENRPTLNDLEIDTLDYRDDIIIGFKTTYCLFLSIKDDLIDNLLSKFKNDEVRNIIRPTNVYSLLLQESYHPDFLRDGLDRNRLFDRLWLALDHQPHLEKIIRYEQDDLESGNIPIFNTYPNSRDIWTSTGKCISELFKTTAMDKVCQRIRGLSNDDLETQLWFIQASLTSIAHKETFSNAKQEIKPSLLRGKNTFNKDLLVSKACEIGDQLEKLAIYEDDLISWIGLTPRSDNHMIIFPMSVDFYSGLSGVAFFLAYLGSISGKESYRYLAEKTLSTLRQHNNDLQSQISLGAFDGAGGIIYTLVHLAVLWKDGHLIEEAEEIVRITQSKIEQEKQSDIISGLAGYTLCLLNLYHIHPSRVVLDAAIRCGDKLIENASTLDVGVGWWNPTIPSFKPLAGFSHGVAGISYALFSLFAVSGDERYRKTAIKAIKYERSIFSKEEGNWPALATSGDPEMVFEYPIKWCHGAPGIGLSRLLSLPYINTARTHQEINQALNTTIKYGFGKNHCLCHGDLGNLDVLLHAQEILGNKKWSSWAKKITGIILKSMNEAGYICGIPMGVETPGLMTGLAGIGYGLLRIAEPARIPSVLALALPSCSSDISTAIPNLNHL